MEPHFKFNSVEPVDLVLDIVRSDLNDHLSVQGVRDIVGWYEDHDNKRNVELITGDDETGAEFVQYVGTTTLPGFWIPNAYLAKARVRRQAQG